MLKWLCFFLILLPSLAYGGERCSQYGGVCRDHCLETEKIEAGDFLDCTGRQECCVPKDLGGKDENGKDRTEDKNKTDIPTKQQK